ncbi:hypothetical protein [Pseudoclavibacter helvolus]|uniref:Uncharacterized protein n=1 Tax=Pseudoclavibacter helvolus TaxID=255205 RepID=A0A7W4UMY2_9MICO|nr:hypothetical protein [Pseudoclavibacter helvolus]MBB2956984.1 hypothetical protein [Pseudoclavibacter helvolus]
MTWEWVAFTVVVAFFALIVIALVMQTIQKSVEAKYRATPEVFSSTRKDKRD